MNNTEITGTVAVMMRDNVDTDQIIPKQFLKSIEKTGYGNYLFDSWRFSEPGELGILPEQRKENANFELNKAIFQGAKILVTGENFGCGSSREHAVWALQQYGFQAIIASSFAGIFADNSQRNSLPLITLKADEIMDIANTANAVQSETTIDLPNQSVIFNGTTYKFEMDEQKLLQLIEGKDDIDLTLEMAEDIKKWEQAAKQSSPWLWD